MSSENNKTEITMVDRRTGKEVKCDAEDLCHLIETVFPDKEEQKELLQAMLRD